MQWDDARMFLALTRAPTMRAAARTLGVNHSTLSRRLRQFEEALGCALFSREPEGLTLTAAGRALRPGAEEMERAFLRMRDQAERFDRGVSGLVRLSMTPGALRYHVLPCLTALRARHPALELELVGTSEVADLLRREVDLAIRNIRPTQNELIARKLNHYTYVIAGAPALLARSGDARAHDWIGWPATLDMIPLARWLTAQGITPWLRVSSFPDQLLAAQRGLGLVLCPPALLDRHQLVELTPPPDAPPLPHEETWLVTHEALRALPRIDAVWRYILEEAGRQATGALPA